MTLLDSFLEQSARRCPDKAALVAGSERLTFAELEAQANRLAHALRSLGVRRGDRVAIHLGNSADAVVSLFAVMKAGAVFTMINPTTKPAKLRFILDDCRARALIAPRRHMVETEHLHLRIVKQSATHSALSPGEGQREGPSTGETPAAPGQPWYTLCELLTSDRFPASPPPKAHIDVDLAALVYTSGSSGEPKGVMLAHRNVTAAARAIMQRIENTADDVILSVLPLSFNYGLYQPLMGSMLGATLVLERSFAYPAAIMQKLADHRATGLPIVPTMLAMMLQLDLSRYDLSHLRYLTNTGAALPVEHIRQFRKRLPHVDLYSMYGLTECKRVVCMPPDELDERPSSVGRPMPNCEAYLIDEDGNRLPHGQRGELVVRGSNVMPGYWERPAETAAAFRPGPLPGEQILHTGDLFRTDEDGYFYFIARKDDIIKSRGEKVSPREVEETLVEHPAVAEAAVVGVPDELLGMAIEAFVARGRDEQPSERELMRHCAARLEDYMIPRKITIRDSLPRTQNGKIDRRALVSCEV